MFEEPIVIEPLLGQLGATSIFGELQPMEFSRRKKRRSSSRASRRRSRRARRYREPDFAEPEPTFIPIFSERGHCFKNPRTGVMMRRKTSGRGFARC